MKPFEREDLQRAFFDVSRAHPYQQFSLLPGGGAQFSASPEDTVIVQPGVFQVLSPIELTAERGRHKVTEVLKTLGDRLGVASYVQFGVNITATVPAPGQVPDARAFVGDRLMRGHDAAGELGPTFFGGGVKYRSLDTDKRCEKNLLVEPWIADNAYVWVNYDVQLAQPFATIDAISEWIDDAFEFVSGPAMQILEV